MSARNAFKGGHWLLMRQICRSLRAALKQQREDLEGIQ